jgi:hypothetical protein
MFGFKGADMIEDLRKSHNVELQILYFSLAVIKVIPVTGCGGLCGCDVLRISHCPDSRIRDGINVGHAYAPAELYSPDTFFCFCE